jgi:UDP:flavonoid glycosyltransferase YjiC (YdhE family)
MRIAIVPVAWSSHYLPMVPLAWAFHAAGHDVRVACQPTVRDAVVGSGMNVQPVGTTYDLPAALAEVSKRVEFPATPAAMRALEPAALQQMLAARFMPHVEAAAAMVEDLVDFVEAWQPDLIMADPIALAAPIAAEVTGARLVRHLFGVDVSRMVGFPTLGLPPERWPAELCALFERFGAEVRPEYGTHTIDPTPTSMQVPVIPNRTAMRWVPYNGADVAPEWLLKSTGQPRLCVTGGATHTYLVGAKGWTVPDIADALTGLDAEVVITIRRAELDMLGPTAPGVRVVADLPLSMLLPTCEAVIHHGGSGTMFTAAFHGVPQVCVPSIPDATLNAAKLAEVGAGIALPAEETSSVDIREAVAAVLTTGDTTHAGASKLRDEIHAEASPSDVVRMLEQLD